MKYIIMETHPSCAIAMDEAGRIVKIANLRYQKGQTVEDPILLDDIGAREAWAKSRRRHKRFRGLGISVAAIFCICILSWHLLLTPFQYMTVYANDKGEVAFALNRIGRVVDAKALSEEGQILLDGVDYFFKSPSTVADQIRDKAAASDATPSSSSITTSDPHLLDEDDWDDLDDWDDQDKHQDEDDWDDRNDENDDWDEDEDDDEEDDDNDAEAKHH